MTGDKNMTILIVDDEKIIHESLGSYLTDSGFWVESAYDERSARKILENKEIDMVLLDVLLPGKSGIQILEGFKKENPDLVVIMITGHGTMEMAVQALRSGATDFLSKPLKLRELDGVLEKVRRQLSLQQERNRLKGAIGFIQKESYKERGDGVMVGNSNATEHLRQQIQIAVQGRFDTILLTGETGTGKEVAAREIHLALGAETPFIAVSCPAIPDNLIESELFGHMKGSFTGASENHPGSFEMADGGILFLDEISELSAQAQAKLLRVLETRCVRRVGSAKEQQVNVTVVAATNIPLDELVSQKRFRQDLLYRLNVFSLELQPLRTRPDDIIPIAEHFLALFTRSRNLHVSGFSKEAVDGLMGHNYPGNTRELRNLVERAAVLTGKGEIPLDALKFMVTLAPGRAYSTTPPVVASSAPPEATPNSSGPSPSQPATNGYGEKGRILEMLERTKWNRKETARLLQMPYSTLRYKLKKFDIR